MALAIVVAIASVWVGRRLAATSRRADPATVPEAGATGTQASRPLAADAGQVGRSQAWPRPARRLGAWDAHVLRDPGRHGNEKSAVLSALLMRNTAWTS